MIGLASGIVCVVFYFAFALTTVYRAISASFRLVGY